MATPLLEDSYLARTGGSIVAGVVIFPCTSDKGVNHGSEAKQWNVDEEHP
jgi:hypothetical protein